MSKEVMAECLEEATALLELYAVSRSQVVLVHLDAVCALAVALYQERMRRTPSLAESSLVSFGSKLVCVTGDGIFQSTDSGNTWKRAEVASNDHQEVS